MLKIEPKNYIKTLKGLFLYGWANNQALRSFRKGSSDRMCCTFHVLRVLKPRRKPGPTLAAIPSVGRRAKPQQCGMPGLVPAGSCWAHLKEWQCLCSQHGTEMRCCSRGQEHRALCPVRGAAHLSRTFRNRLLFLSTLATWNEEWTDVKDIAVLGVYAKTFP